MTPAQIAAVEIRQPALLNALKTHCKNGHELAGENLRIKTHRGRPERVCLTCRRADHLERTRRRIFDAHPSAPDRSLVIERGMPVDVWKRIDVEASGCWAWTGTKNQNGYGHTAHGPLRRNLVHRFVFQLLVGPVPEGLELDHLCRVRHCCNPEHLEPVTHRENVLRAFAARKAAA